MGKAVNREPTIADVLQAIKQIEVKLDSEVQRWDERFFQLSRDTLNFTRNVVTTAAVVAVIVPIFRDLIPIFVEQLSRR
jgi:MerR family transcriptional regulator, repressor of the yfmOP operon